MQLFLQACAIPYAHLELVAKQVKDLGFAELDTFAASTYLGGTSGRVWQGVFQSRHYAIAVRPEQLCTVIAHDGDPRDVKTAVESWLPPPDSGISVKQEIIPSPGELETTAYELRGGKVAERWVLTISNSPQSQIRAMLSWSHL